MTSNYMERENNRHEIVIWCRSTDILPYAASVKKLIKPRHVVVHEIDQSPFVEELAQQLRKLSSGSKLAIFIQGRFVGGYREILTLLQKGGRHKTGDRFNLLGEESFSNTSATEDISFTDTESSQQEAALVRSPRRNLIWTNPSSHTNTATATNAIRHPNVLFSLQHPEFLRNRCNPQMPSRLQSTSQLLLDGKATTTAAPLSASSSHPSILQQQHS